MPHKGVHAYHSCRYDEALAIFSSAQEKAKPKDVVLFDLAVLSSAMHLQDQEKAKHAATHALEMMWSDVGKAQGQASLVSSEALRVFKGEPFERAMAAVYAGVLFFNEGDFDNARASFGKAIMATQTKEEEFRDNFALPYLLSAKTLFELGETDNGKIALERAKSLYPDHPFLDLDIVQKSNLLVFFELGLIPKKTRTGPGGSLVHWTSRKYPEKSVQLQFKDGEMQKPELMADLGFQARTKGWTDKDTLQATKGALREASGVTAVIAADHALRTKNETAGWVALGAGLFAIANQSQADIRQWELLPDKIHVWIGQKESGNHELFLRYYDYKGEELPEFRNEKSALLEASKPQILWIRGMPCHE